jgi:AI-2 transport protein TqsA
MPSSSLPPLHRTVLLGAGLVVIAAGLHAAGGTVNLILVSALLAMTLSPIPILLEGRGLKHGPAVALTVLGALVGGALLVSGLAAGLSGLQAKLPAYQESLSGLLSGLEGTLTARGIDIHEALKPDATRVVEVVRTVAGGALGALGYSLFALILVALILAELPARGTPEAEAGSLTGHFAVVGVSVRRFVGLTGLMGAGQAVANLLVMLAVGTDFPLVWAVLFFLLNFVPFGFILGMIPPLVVTLLEHGPARAGILLAVTFLINVISDNVVKPKVMGQGLGLSPLVIVLSLMAWSVILGPMGAILAVPLTIALTLTMPRLSGGISPAG